MLDPKIEQALNKQINQEMAAAYNYFAMVAWLERHNLTGFSSWMQRQRSEELEHAQRLFNYVLDRGGKVDLSAVEKPQADFKGVADLFDTAFAMEQENTRCIHELYALARSMDDYATQSHLQWFLDEQVEEEKVFGDVQGLLELAGEDKSALLQIDDRLGRRGAPEAT